MSPGDTNDERMRAALAALLEIKGDGEECPPAGTIWDSVEGRLGREENEAVLIHLGECAACSAAWRLAHRLHSEAVEEGETVGAGLPRRSSWLPLAAAAIIVVGVGLGVVHLTTRQDAPPEYRTQEDRWLESELAPDQPLPRDECVLRWTAGPEGTTYDLRLTTEDLDPLARAGRLERPEYRVEPGVLEGVPPGGAVLWRVTAHLPDGGRVSSRTFTTPLE